MTRPYPVEPVFPNPALPGADWADSYEIMVFSRMTDAEQAAREALGPMPVWAKQLLWLRNRLVGWVGLKPALAHPTDSGSPMIGPFPIVRNTANEIVLGFDDRHLDFRIVINLAEAAGGAQHVRATTLVKRHNLSGRLYLAAVMPFHKLIVKSTLNGLCHTASTPAQLTGVSR